MADILLHTYGSSRSEKLNVLLTHMGEYIIKNHRLLEKAEAKWDKFGLLRPFVRDKVNLYLTESSKPPVSSVKSNKQ